MVDRISRLQRTIGSVVLATLLASTGLAFGAAAAQAQSLPATDATGATGATGAGTTTTTTPTTTTAAGSGASATTAGQNGHKTQVGHPNFEAAQKQLENALQLRVEQLTKLSADVSANSATLGSNAATLSGLLSAEQTSINGLVTQVQQATTFAELSSSRKTMLVDNRVFAVMTPQVIETIEADSTTHQVQSLQADEPGLQAAVNSVAGEPGWRNADYHYVAFVKLVNQASGDSAGVVAKILAITPPMWPNVEHAFVLANHALLQADLDIARANYDATVIGLATGGYTGS
jgi:hypothetical protein